MTDFVEQLQDRQIEINVWRGRADAAEAEVERLAEALREIDRLLEAWPEVTTEQAIARAALAHLDDDSDLPHHSS